MQNKFGKLTFTVSMLLLCSGCVISNGEQQESAMQAADEAYRNQPAWQKRGQRVTPMVSKTVVLPAGKDQQQ